MHAQTVDTRPLFPLPTWPGYEASLPLANWAHVYGIPAAPRTQAGKQVKHKIFLL